MTELLFTQLFCTLSRFEIKDNDRWYSFAGHLSNLGFGRRSHLGSSPEPRSIWLFGHGTGPIASRARHGLGVQLLWDDGVSSLRYCYYLEIDCPISHIHSFIHSCIFVFFRYVRAMQYFDNLVISSATLLEPVVAEFMAFSFGVGTLPGLQGWAGNLLVAAGTFAVVYKPAGISGEEGKSLH
jgi:hypothetical protein